MKKMIVWALFDSGNGSYTKGVNHLNHLGKTNIDIFQTVYKAFLLDAEKKGA